MGVKIKGLDQVIDTIKRLPKHLKDASAVGQFNAAQETMKLSKTRAPYEHGDLEKAAFVELPRFTAQAVVVDMGYSGLDYVAIQHENLDYKHPGTDTKTDNPGRAQQGQAKFLESAVDDTEEETEQAIQEAIDFFIRTGSLPKMSGPVPPRKA